MQEEKQNCGSTELIFDEACVTLSSQVDKANLWLYTLSADCVAVSYRVYY